MLAQNKEQRSASKEIIIIFTFSSYSMNTEDSLFVQPLFSLNYDTSTWTCALFGVLVFTFE